MNLAFQHPSAAARSLSVLAPSGWIETDRSLRLIQEGFLLKVRIPQERLAIENLLQAMLFKRVRSA